MPHSSPPPIIILNGPAGSGKTTLARSLVENHSDYTWESPAEVLREALIALAYNSDYVGLYEKLTEVEFKSTLLPQFPPDSDGGVTVRQALIDLGNLCRSWSPTFLSEVVAEKMHVDLEVFSHVIYDNARVYDDIDGLLAYFEPSSMVLVEINRDNCTWTHDMGKYLHISYPTIPYIHLHNNGSIEALTDTFLSSYQSL